MTFINACTEHIDLGGRRHRHIIGIKPVAYNDAGMLRAIVNDYVDGDANFPHVNLTTPMMTYVAADGMRRLCPTRDPARYVEIGAPYIKPAGTWQKVALGTPARSGNMLTWTTAQANVYAQNAGHFVKLGILLKGGWQPPGGQFAFPVGMAGLTRTGGQFFADGVPVLSVRAPHVEDYDNPADMRPIAWQLVQVASQWYILFTLPSLAGMAKPLIDPTFSVQPDAADGLDTYIDAGAATTNFGSDALGVIGHYINRTYRTLIKFNLATLPDNATITSCTLSIWELNEYSDNQRTVRVYRTKRAWVEAQTTWNIYSTGNSWSTAGGFHADDCEQTDIGSRVFSATETEGEFKDFPLTPTTKAALDLGNGWLVKSDTEANDSHNLASSDHATAAYRPKLVIDYAEMFVIGHRHENTLLRM